MSGGGALVLTCKVDDYDATTGQCVAPFYTYPPTAGFPPLSLDDAQTIGLAIAVLWAAAWGIRRVKRLLDQL